jgi:hypothetical protein
MADEGQGVVQRMKVHEQDARNMKKGSDALVKDRSEKYACDTGGDNPEGIAAGVAGEDETFCLGRGDAAESDK